MATTTDIDEQIWEEDIDRFAEDTLALWKTQFRYWQRAKAQGAPQALLDEMAEISELYKEAHARLIQLQKCFPKAE